MILQNFKAFEKSKPKENLLNISESQEYISRNRNKRHSKREVPKISLRYVYYSDKEFEYQPVDSSQSSGLADWIQILILYSIAVGIAGLAFGARKLVVDYYIRKGNRINSNRKYTVHKKRKKPKQNPSTAKDIGLSHMTNNKDVKDVNTHAKDNDKDKVSSKVQTVRSKSTESDTKTDSKNTKKVNKIEESVKKKNNESNKKASEEVKTASNAGKDTKQTEANKNGSKK